MEFDHFPKHHDCGQPTAAPEISTPSFIRGLLPTVKNNVGGVGGLDAQGARRLNCAAPEGREPMTDEEYLMLVQEERNKLQSQLKLTCQQLRAWMEDCTCDSAGPEDWRILAEAERVLADPGAEQRRNNER